MPTSGTYTWTANRDFVITQAFKKINALGNWEALDTPRLNDGINTLEPILKHYASMGMPLWAIDKWTVFMSAFTTPAGIELGIGAPTYNMIPAPLKVIHAYRTVNTYDVPLQLYTNVDYQNLSNKGAFGTPIGLYYKPKGALGTLQCWPLPSADIQASGTITIFYQRPFQDAGTSTATLDFPQEWSRTLILALACDLAPNYGLDMTQRQQLEKQKEESLKEILGASGEEGSFYIHPARRL